MKIKHILLFLLLFLSIGLTGQESSIGDTIGSFNAGVLTPTPDRNLFGIEFAENHFWITGSDPDDSYQHKLYKISKDGELVEYYEYGLEFAGWSDLAYDGEFLYVADIDTIRQINMETGQKTGVKIPAPEYYLRGLAYDSASGNFWVSGDGNIIYEIARDGEIMNSISFIPDLPASGLAWDVWTEGGPYLWVWSMKYTPDDVRPKAFQINPATGLLTGLEFEGAVMHPNYPYGADYALGISLTQDLYEDKVVFVSLHASSYQENNDQLDWVVMYDLYPEGTGIPGPVIDVNPVTIQNDLYPGDSVDIPIYIGNNSADYNLEWVVSLEYPWSDASASAGDSLLAFNASLVTADTNTNLRGMAYIGESIYISSGLNFEDQFFVSQMSKDGTELLGTDTLYSAFSGWTALTADDQYLYGVQQYMIQAYNPATNSVVETYPRPNFSPNAIAYDPQMEHFYLGNGVGAIMKVNKQGDELNFYVVPFPVEGMAWDKWSPGGPYLWAYYQPDESSGTLKAVRLDPATGGTTGVEFFGQNLSGDPDFPDRPKDIFITPDWQQDKLVMIALHASNSQPGDGQDKIVVYDLDATPAPGWIDILPPSFGATETLGQDSVYVRLNAIMEDTLMSAQIVINSNDVSAPKLIIPVNFLMLPAIQTDVGQPFEQNESSFVKVYPNPARSKVSIAFDKIEEGFKLYCYNNQGKLLMKMDVDQGAKSFDINVSDWPSGIYTLLMRGQKIYAVEQLIVN